MQHIWIFFFSSDISFPKAINVQHGFYFFSPSRQSCLSQCSVLWQLCFPTVSKWGASLCHCWALDRLSFVPGKVWEVNLSCIRKSEPITALPTCPKANLAALLGRRGLCGTSSDLHRVGKAKMWLRQGGMRLSVSRQLQAFKVKDSSI